MYLKTITPSSLIDRYFRVAVSIYAKLWVRCHTGVKMQRWGEGAATSSQGDLFRGSSCVIILKNYCAVHC